MPTTPRSCAPRPTVQLRHDLPDGTWHVDWMLAQDPRGEEPLVTFRVAGRVDELDAAGAGDAACDAERIADHRPAYLEYEGPVSGGRGEVRRLARGAIVACDEGADAMTLAIAWERDHGPPGPPGHLRLTRIAGDRWEVRAVSLG